MINNYCIISIVVKVSPTNTITDMYFSLLSSMAKSHNPASVQKSPEKQKGKIHGYLYV